MPTSASTFTMLADVFFFIFIIVFGNAGLWSGFLPSIMSLMGSVFALNIALFNLYNFSILPNYFINDGFYKVFADLSKKVHFSQLIYYFIIFLIFRLCFYWIGKNFDKLLSILPIWNVISKLLGFIFGIFQGILYLVIILGAMKYFDFHYDFGKNSHIFDCLSDYIDIIYPHCEKVFSIVIKRL